jgi:hypothetical protein
MFGLGSSLSGGGGGQSSSATSSANPTTNLGNDYTPVTAGSINNGASNTTLLVGLGAAAFLGALFLLKRK